MLDFRELNDDQLLMSELIFDEFRDKDLKPAYLADADPKRALLDRRVVCDLLGFDQTVYEAVRRLAAKWVRRTLCPRRQTTPERVIADYLTYVQETEFQQDVRHPYLPSHDVSDQNPTMAALRSVSAEQPREHGIHIGNIVRTPGGSRC